MLAALVAAAVVAACVWASLRRLSRLRAGLGAEIERHAGALGRVRTREQLRRASAALPPDGALARLLGALLDADGRAAAVAELNDAVSELSSELAIGAEVPRAAARIALAAGTAAAVVVVAARLPGEGVAALVPATVAFALGVGGAAACSWIGRVAGEWARRQREAGNELLRALERTLPREVE